MSVRPEARRKQSKAARSGRNSFGYLYDSRTGSGRRSGIAMREYGSGYSAGRVRAGSGKRKAERSIVNAGYVIFLALMCIATVLMCVRFLQLKESVTLLNRQNALLETQHTELKRENDARYENVTNSIDWDHIRDVAINKLNMKYADKDQIVWYNSASDGYVHQYTDVPDKDSR